ncbi:putative disease resistance protein RGA3 isoform X1 [Carex rostrata]
MAMILDAFLSKFIDLLVQMVQDEVGMLLGIPGQIEMLGETVRDIQCVLADAERKQSKSSAIERWLMQLKDVMYDADDIIDLCQIKAKDCLAGSSSHSSSNAHCGFPLLSCFQNPFFAHKIGSKIKDINSRLEGIAKRKAGLGLIESQVSSRPSDPVPRVDSIITRKTDPLVVLDDIVGEKIEEDTEMLVNWLTEEEKSEREIILVLAIVGMGGIGKTTLASKIFNDRRIQEEFQLKIWVCVSKEVKGVELLKCMIREAGGEHGAAQERSELAPILKRLVQGKKFLLVLDDVWEESRAVWDGMLRTPMSGGAHGSRLLVTTRDGRVADGMRAAKLHRVEKLSDEDGWSLLIKQVFQNEQESEIQEFKNIGLQLVKKCDGLPLAIKTIGGVLCTKLKTKVEWQTVLRSNMWSIVGVSSIHNAFHLSYEDLSSPLKQCFIFCSLFPEDFKFDQMDLIYQWLAEGYLQDKVDFWELGNKYYTELLVRNLLEATEHFYDQAECRMHDLLWSFARQLGKDENCVLREGDVLSRPDGPLKIRRLSIEGNKVNTELFKKENGLRTLFLRDKPEISLDYVCKAFSNLRMLDLRSSNFSSLPNSLCELMHLRYLDVAGSKITKLPNSIGNLKYLAYLNLTRCKILLDVPRSITNLQELKLLETTDSGVRGIPLGLNKLEKLVQLLGFRPDETSLEGFSSLDSIEALSQLISLMLYNLEKVSDKNIANRANLLKKGRLQDLRFVYGTLSPEEQLSQTNEKKKTTEDVLNELCPPPSLEIVEIVGYFGSHLPNWLNLRANLPNLRYLTIENCACFEELALLGQLPNLDYLRIIGAYSVVNVGEEFLWGGIQNRDTIAMSCHANKSTFPKLRKLNFTGMPNWKEWQWNKGQVAMPKLKILIIRDCPQLRSVPEGLLHHATSLECLEIDGANKLITVENLPSIKDIRVFRCPNLERISNLPNISYILLEKCPNIKAVENLKALHTMALVDFNMEILPNYLRMTMPHKLRIRCSEALLVKIVSEGESGSERNKFIHIPKVTIYSSGESLNATYQKTPYNFTTNVRTSSEMMRDDVTTRVET